MKGQDKIREQLINNIYAESPIGIELYDSDGQLLDANQACLDMFGVSDVAEVKGFKLFEDPNMSDEAKARLRKGETVRYKVPFDFEKVRELGLYETTKSGIVYLDVLITLLRLNKKGPVDGYLVQVQDITEWVRAEEALQKAHDELEVRVEERTAELVEANEALQTEITEWVRAEEALRFTQFSIDRAGDAAFWMDSDAHFFYVNDATCRSLGYSREELLSMTVHDIDPDFSKGVWPEHWREVKQRGSFTLESHHRTKDGRIFPVEITVNYVEFDGKEYNCAFARDITKWVQAEETLRQRNRELALLNQMGQDLTATLDRQRVTERLLQAVTETVGAEGASLWLWEEEQEPQYQSRRDASQGWLVCRACFHIDQHHISPLNLRVRSGQGIVGWVVRNGKSVIVPCAPDDPRFFPGVDAQTGFRTLSLLAAPLWARGKVIGALETVNKRDDTFDEDDLALVETLAASAAIALDNARLIEALRQYTAELEASNEELDAFAHSAAHDLKGPLGHMVGFAETLAEDCTTLPDEELRRYLHTIAQSGRKMSNIIDELLLLAIVRKVEEVEMGPLDMEDIVAEALGRLTYMIEEYQAEVILPERWPVALGYGPWVEEVWVNYLSNALKYGGDPPHVELGFDKPANQQIGKSANQRNDNDLHICTFAHLQIRFWVRDKGPGLTLEEQERLFTPFTQLDPRTWRVKGYGLGLSIVRRIVEKLGGQVGVESQVGQGSLFWFTLPLQAGE